MRRTPSDGESGSQRRPSDGTTERGNDHGSRQAPEEPPPPPPRRRSSPQDAWQAFHERPAHALSLMAGRSPAGELGGGGGRQGAARRGVVEHALDELPRGAAAGHRTNSQGCAPVTRLARHRRIVEPRVDTPIVDVQPRTRHRRRRGGTAVHSCAPNTRDGGAGGCKGRVSSPR